MVVDEHGEDLISSRDIFERFEIPRKKGWLGRAIEGFVSRGWATDTRTFGTEDDWDIFLNAAGFRRGEELSHYVELIERSNDEDLISQGRLASVEWNGVSRRLGDAGLKEIREKAMALRASVEQSDLDPRQRANALKHVDAVVDLLDAPDPPWEIVVDLLNNRYFSAILNAMAILQLITGLAF